MAIQVIIKARNIAQAVAEAQRRHIALTNAREAHANWIVADAPDDVRERVVKWFVEDPHSAPYPFGTLLHYSEAWRAQVEHLS